MIPFIIAESQLRHSTSYRRALVNRLDQQPPAHEVNQTSTTYNVLRIPQLHVNIAEKVTL